jgi:ATP-binding cassette subfamily C (CFTR/MRP) protein 1
MRKMQSDSAFSQVNTAVPITEVSDAVSNKGNQKKCWTKIANPFRSKQEPPVPTERQPCPEHKAGFFSLLIFQWMASFMQVGYQRSLELNDIWDVNPHRSVPVMQIKLLASFERRRESGDKNPLRNALYDTF